MNKTIITVLVILAAAVLVALNLANTGSEVSSAETTPAKEVENAAESVKEAGEKAADAVASGAEKAADDLAGTIETTVDEVKEAVPSDAASEVPEAPEAK